MSSRGRNRSNVAIWGNVQKVYKWWTHAEKAGSPRDIYQATKEVAKDVAIVGGGMYVGGRLLWNPPADVPSANSLQFGGPR